MKIDKFLKRKWSSKIQCPICISTDIKKLSLDIINHGEKINLVTFTFLCLDDHMWHFKEFVKAEDLLKGD